MSFPVPSNNGPTAEEIQERRDKAIARAAEAQQNILRGGKPEYLNRQAAAFELAVEQIGCLTTRLWEVAA